MPLQRDNDTLDTDIFAQIKVRNGKKKKKKFSRENEKMSGTRGFRKKRVKNHHKSFVFPSIVIILLANFLIYDFTSCKSPSI